MLLLFIGFSWYLSPAIQFAVVINAWRQMKTHTRTREYKHIDMYKHACMWVHTHMDGDTRTRTHGYIQTCRHTYSVNSHDEKLVMYNDNNRRKQPCVIYTFYIKEFLLCLGTCVATYRRRRDVQRKSRSNIVSSFPSFQWIHSSGEQCAGISLQNDKSLVLMLTCPIPDLASIKSIT